IPQMLNITSLVHQRKMVFPGSCSSSMGPEVIDIDDWTPKALSRSNRKGKRKEVPVHEIIDVDMYEDPSDVVFIQGKAESTKTMKGTMGISLGSGSSVQSDSKRVKSKTKGKLDNLRKFGNDEGMRKYENFKKFDTVVDHSDHFYSNQNSTQKQPPKNWTKKIQGDWKILEKDLPDTIFVRVYESRMDLLRAAIIGAEGTPYHDGLFFFDVCFPSTYPQIPPLVHYHSGGLRINPNLYNCGKVCLSLLNTWTGGANEMWNPRSSTMLQVLVSIQGLILNAKPYFNEPGWAPSSGSIQGQKRALNYNENTLILSLKTMVYTMKKQPKYFEDLVVGHFRYHVRDILMACKAYTEGVQVGSLMRGGVQDVDEGQESCSYKFKTDLVSYIKVLIAAFKSIGAKEGAEFLFLSQKKIPKTVQK
nr:probable ubiquitin-conjugating enzyme E2 25 [Tanacetum cinerariifolium]